MDIRKLKEIVDFEVNNLRDYQNLDVVVEIKTPGLNVGGTPCVKVVSYDVGFDWDAGKFILKTQYPLTKG